MHKHASWIVALLVGLATGVLADRMVGGGGSIGGAKKPSDLPANAIKETDLPPGTLAGLTDQQKYNVLKGITDRYGAQGRPAPRPQEDPRAVYKVPVDDSPVKGPPDALVTVVESSDFQCPFCKRVLPTLKQIEDTYKGKVRFVFKENPLSFHDKALAAAEAAEEARAQGGNAKFWAMHDKLFEMAPALERPNLEKAARELGLDMNAFRRALDSGRHEARIRRDQALASSLGANGTPSFFINGRKVTGALPFEAFKTVIDEELRKAEEMVKSGVASREVYAKVIEKGATAPVMVAGAPSAPPPAAPAPTASKVEIRSDDPVRGPKHAKVTVVLFSDFQCPFCSRVEPTLKQLLDNYKDSVRVVWKHQPLPFHPNAMPAAEAAEAARAQGKFWEMHDLMFAHQSELSPAKYEEWGRSIGLDMKRYAKAIEAHAGQARIAEDQKLGNSVGANGTPTLFVNCRQIVGAQPYERFKSLVDEEIAKADALLKSGAKLDDGFYDRICAENVKAAPAQIAAAPAPSPQGPVKIDLRPDDPVKGDARAPITVVVFSDFQCPFCGRAEATLKQIEDTYGSKVKLAWKHEPLPFHPNALPAAEAAEAAREQGKFWPMHDKLFSNQQALSPESYERYAQELGLDMARFRAAVQGHKYKARIDEDAALAQKVGAQGTPTFFINGERLVGAQPFDAFKQVIDRELEKTARR